MSSRACLPGFLSCVLLSVSPPIHAADEPAKVPEVMVARPLVREVTDHEEFTGRVEASAQVELRPRVTGFLTATRCDIGDLVNEGAVLFEIDPRPYQARLNEALSQVELHKATLQLARATLARDQALAKAAAGSVSRQQLDRDQAAVEEALARVKAAEASADVYKLNLSFCTVTAPIKGRVGGRLVSNGNLVIQDQTLLGTLFGEDPLYVSFDIDERTFLRLRRWLREGKAAAGKLPVAVGLPGEEGFPHRGVLNSIADQVVPESGAIRLRAVLANKDKLLLPGMFVRVRLPLSAPYKALLVSDRAIGSDQGVKYVYVVDNDNKVQYRRVTNGALQSEGLRVISQGLKPDDRVIVGRRTGVRPGMTVRPLAVEMPAPRPAQPSEGSASARGQAGPGILVETTYAGANAQAVSDAVRSPIEQQVGGLENIRYLRSRCTNDGKYALDVAFAAGVDRWRSQVLVQNRVALAAPELPREVQDAGVTIRGGTAGVLLIVSLSSPDGKYDPLYLGNYATIQLKDELARLAGVGEVALLGASDYSLRIVLDMDRLAAFNLNAGDVTRILRDEKCGGGADVENLGDLIVKVDAPGRAVRLRDVAAVDLGAVGRRSEAFQDNKPVVALVVALTGDAVPRKVSAAVRDKLAELRARMPEGLALDVAFDFTAKLEAPEKPAGAAPVLIDLDFPVVSAAETGEVLRRGQTLLLQEPGVRRVLALAENPFDLFGGRPCLLVQLDPNAQRPGGRAEVLRTFRARLDRFLDVTVRVRDFAAPGCGARGGYPIDLALSGPEGAEVRAWAEKLADRLRGTRKLTDVWMNADSAPRPGRFVEVNRALAAARGVAVADIFRAIEVCSGTVLVNHFNRFGRSWRVEVQAGGGSGDWARDLGKLRVRNSTGQMVALSGLVTLREVDLPAALDFLDLRPMVQVTANVETGVALEAGQKLCVVLAEEVRKELGLTAEYRLTWLHASPSGK